jgi:hypothetical protein
MARTNGARSMRVVPSAAESSGSAEPVEEMAGRTRATGAGGRSTGGRALSPSGAAFGGEGR